MTSNQIEFKMCSKCKRTLPATEFGKNKRATNGLLSTCRKCISRSNAHYHKKTHPLSVPYTENRSCASFLGCHVAEQVLQKTFKNVELMPYGYPGYDFICNKGMKVDVKSACSIRDRNAWRFNICQNTVADYFLLIAFDNRHDLNPLHLWMIPGNTINHLKGTGISLSTIQKWDEYELDISKTSECCTSLK